MVNFRPGSEIIDIGTGGGFPGVPLAIFFPEVEFLLVDSIAKKLKVIDAVVAETGLTNITTRHSRAEEIKNMLATKGSVDASSEVLSSAVIQNLREKQATANQKVSELSAVYLPNHPKMIAAEMQKR